MKTVKDTITIQKLQQMATATFGSLVKAVVDIDKNIMVVDAELHADQESHLLEKGSRQENLWGINMYPAEYGSENFVEFDSMINLRPNQNNLTRSVEDVATQKKILNVVDTLVIK